MERVRLDELTGGALQEKFDRAMETVIGNMQDPNTPSEKQAGDHHQAVF